MAANGYVSRPHERGGTLASALIAYGQQGGALFAAYRLPDNPLVLSHVRWQGTTGEVIEAQHNPDEMYSAPQEEREAWAQIALSSTTAQADATGPNAPWLPVHVERERAFELGLRAQRARMSGQFPRAACVRGAVWLWPGVLWRAAVVAYGLGGVALRALPLECATPAAG